MGLCARRRDEFVLADAEGHVAVRLSDYQTRPARIPSHRSDREIGEFLLHEILQNIESIRT